MRETNASEVPGEEVTGVPQTSNHVQVKSLAVTMDDRLPAQCGGSPIRLCLCTHPSPGAELTAFRSTNVFFSQRVGCV